MKGQYFSFDAIVASVIFVLALMALLSYWHSVRTYLDYQNNDIQRESIRISNLLFAPPYYSGGDDCTNIDRLGLAKSWDERVVDSRLLDCAQEQDQISPNWLKERLATPYNVSLTVTYLPLADSDDILTFGDVIPDDADPNAFITTEVVIMRRLAAVEDSDTGDTRLAEFDLRVFR